jgi:hypothetical protein
MFPFWAVIYILSNQEYPPERWKAEVMDAAVTAVVILTLARKDKVVNLLSRNVDGDEPAGKSK